MSDEEKQVEIKEKAYVLPPREEPKKEPPSEPPEKVEKKWKAEPNMRR